MSEDDGPTHPAMKLGTLGIVWLGLVLAAPCWAEERPVQETCPHPADWKPTNEELQRMLSEHRQWLLKSKEAQSDSEGRANLCNADLSFAELNDAFLAAADLSNAKLHAAKLNNAFMSSAHLTNADMSNAELNNANLVSADLSKADFSGAELNNADLRLAKLNKAKLLFTSVAGAKIAAADLTGATYAPASLPPDSYVAEIKGLSTLILVAGHETGLVQLRNLLQNAGLRDLEREATFVIEKGKTNNLIDGWRDSPTGAAEGTFRYVAFDFTTAYGLRPGQALMLIVALWVLLIPVYAWPICRSKRPPTAGAIYRIWPKDRVEVRDDHPTLDNPARVEQLHTRGLNAIAWSAYFSLLSTFQIGFREFSVGTWLTRTQPRNFALEATGWVRTLSGVQSLLSVYLLAMWLLTYFGRPFQ